jgi:acid stress-induced BolA-like protein IbaG/YrbA
MGSLAELAERVTEILRDSFAPAEVVTSTRNGIVVFVVSDRFEGIDDMDRQEMVWDVLENQLDQDERRSVSIVVALTSKEHAFHSAGSLG